MKKTALGNVIIKITEGKVSHAAIYCGEHFVAPDDLYFNTNNLKYIVKLSRDDN